MGAEVNVDRPIDGVAVVTMADEPRRNALPIAMRDRVSDVFDELAANESIRCIVLTGTGSVFSSGFDLTEFGPTNDAHVERLWRSSDRFHHTILRCPIPVIAAVNGPALAGGFDLAVLADLRVAASTARFAHVEQPFSEVVYRPLRDLVGGGVARELVLTGRSVSAEEALAIGLVNQVTAVADLLPAALSMAAAVARAPRRALVRTKVKIVAAAAIPADTHTLDL